MADRKKRILIVDDDKGIHLATKYVLREKYDCVSAYNGDEAKIIVQSQPVDILLLDIHMRRHEEGLEYLPQLKELDLGADGLDATFEAATDDDLCFILLRGGVPEGRARVERGRYAALDADRERIEAAYRPLFVLPYVSYRRLAAS